MPAATTINEVDFCARVASIANEIFHANPEIPFNEARIEGVDARNRTRKDLRFYDRSGKLNLCGEVKLPGTAQGRTPYDDEVLQDAFIKAERANVRFFFTWNVSTFALWDRQKWDVPLLERRVRVWNLNRSLSRPEDAGRPDVHEELTRNFL